MAEGGGISVYIGTRGMAVVVAVAALVTGAFVVPVITGGGGGGGTFPNTAGANVFIATNGNDAGVNCKRYTTAEATPPTATTVCDTAARAYELMENGDTAWVLPGNYGTSHAWDFEDNAPASFKTSVGDDCHATHECLYFIPQPGQESNVTVTDENNASNWPGFKPDKAPDNLFYANFTGARMCVSWSGGTSLQTTGFHQDITVDNLTGTDCTFFIKGPWVNIRMLNSEVAYNCDTEGTAGGSAIQANDNFSVDGESDEHGRAPSQVLIKGNWIHDFVINGCGPVGNPHMDCIHVYAMHHSTFDSNVFDNCFDSSLLIGGLDENGYDEAMVVQNNWFGPTGLGANNCCLRGTATEAESAQETFDGFVIRFNTVVGQINNKDNNIFNGVTFIGNISTAGSSCGGSGSGQVWSYNVFGNAGCTTGGTGNLTSQSAGQMGLADTATPVDLHIDSGSVANSLVPGSQSGGCATVGVDREGAARSTPCDAGADER